MNLDIGAGSPKIKNNEFVFLNGENVIHLDKQRPAFHLEIVGTVYNLPFRNSIFDVVYLRHVLEHLDNPLLALKEIKRVAKNKVIIQVPNASFFRFKSSSDAHIFSWNQYTLKNLLDRLFSIVKIATTKRYYQKRSYIKKIIFGIACLFLGNNELTAICYKIIPKNK